MTNKLLTEHHLEFLSLKGGCTGLSGSTHVKMPICWKSHVVGQITFTKWPPGVHYNHCVGPSVRPLAVSENAHNDIF